MEEQKKKVVEMQPVTKETERPEKMSYEQLEQVAHQLSEQARQLYSQLQKSNMTNMFKQYFLEKCIAEIEELMTVPEVEEDNKEEETPDTKTED